MRYTEHDFTIDHIFDFIRILFSSVFIAPWRLLHNITLKLIFIDKDKLKRFAQVAIGLNLILICTECIGLARAVDFSFMYTKLPALILCFILLAMVYYAIGIYDQPRISYGKKPPVFEVKAPIVIPGVDELEIEDEIATDQNLTKEKSNEEITSFEEQSSELDSLEDDGMDFSNVLSGSINIEKLRETSEEYSAILKSAYDNDEFNMAAFTELNQDSLAMFDAMASDEGAQCDDMFAILDDIDFDTIAG